VQFRTLASSFVLVVACGDSKTETASGASGAAAGSVEGKVDKAPEPDIWIDHRGVCRQTVEYKCKPDRTCNPPPPKEVTCPPGVREKWLSEITVAPNGECSKGGSPIFCPPELEPKPPAGQPVDPAPDSKAAK